MHKEGNNPPHTIVRIKVPPKNTLQKKGLNEDEFPGIPKLRRDRSCLRFSGRWSYNTLSSMLGATSVISAENKASATITTENDEFKGFGKHTNATGNLLRINKDGKLATISPLVKSLKETKKRETKWRETKLPPIK